jgi:hypothetical protein
MVHCNNPESHTMLTFLYRVTGVAALTYLGLVHLATV